MTRRSCLKRAARHWARVVLGSCASVAALACNDAPKAADKPVTLHAFATVTLAEIDSVFIGRSNSIAVSTTDDRLVTDMPSNRALRFDAAGRLRGTIGRYGNGPNEFADPGSLTSIDDSTLLVVDHIRRDAVIWDLRLNEARQRLDVTGVPGTFVVNDGRLLVGAPDIEHGTLGLEWERGATQPIYRGKIRP